MLTTTDLKKIKEITRGEIQTELRKELKKYATKNDLSNVTKELIDLIYSFRTESKEDNKKTSQELKSELKNDILDFKDSILHEIIKLREDITVVIGYSDRIEDHDQLCSSFQL